MTWINATTPEWFTTMGMRMVTGRDFSATDRRGGELVAVVNETFAHKYFPGQQPVGQSVVLSGPSTGTRYLIVGLVADAIYRSPREGMVPTLYMALTQRDSVFSGGSLTVSTLPGQRAQVQRALAAALATVDPSASFTFRTFDAYLAATVTQERLVAMLSTFFGGLALLLAGIGLYGVVSHAVGRRRQEIGIRMALGSDAAGIVRLVFGRVSVLLAAGVVAGLGLSVWVSRFVKAMLFQLDANDPVTMIAAVVVLVAVGALAAWIPARRAARIDPAVVLRDGN
jgi:predicted lysophospholipase L1 biosynthesis ABC-type transport system permease subunit